MPSVFKNLRRSLSKATDGKSADFKRRDRITSDTGARPTQTHPSIEATTSRDSFLTSPQSPTSNPSSNGSAVTIPSSPNAPYGLMTQQSHDSSVSDASQTRPKQNRRSVFSLDLAKQAVDQIVSRAVIHVESIKVGDLTPEGFHLSMVIRVGKTGPTKAKITFPDGLDLYLDPSHARPLASINLSPIKIKNSTRTNGLVVDGRLNTQPDKHSSSARGLDSLFRKLITSSGPVPLKIGSSNTEIKAYGMSFKRITLEKEIVLDGLDSLGGALSFLPASATSSAPIQQRNPVKDFQIVGGDPKAGISFKAKVELFNPAEITARLGDIRLRLQTDIDELRSDQDDQNALIGSVVLPDLTLKPGATTVPLHGNVLVAPPGDPTRLAGITLIRYLLENRSVSINVVGSQASSKVPWVAAIFASVRISALLPALGIGSKLLDGASLIPPEDAVLSPQPQLYARATLRNMLGPPLHIHSLWVEAFQDIEPASDTGAPADAATRLGDIRTPADSPVLTLSSDQPVHASLPFSLTAGGSSYVRILKNEAKRKGMELNENLIAALNLMPDADGPANLTSVVSSSRKGTRSNSDEVLDLPNLVASALSSLKVSAHVVAQVSIGQYRIPGEINFVQRQLPIAITVKTARNILPTIGAPLVDALIEQARVSISKLKILDMDEKGLNIEAEIGLVDFGPLDVEIHFDQGLNITSSDPSTTMAEEQPVIGRIVFAEALRGVAGSEELLKTRLRILPAPGPKSVPTFAAFVSEIIQKDAVPVQISSNACRVVAGGANFPAVLSKSIVLPGLGGLQGLELEGLDIFDEVAAPTGPGRGRALSSASASSGSSGHLNSKDKAFKIRTRVRIPHKGLLAVALSKIEAGIEFEGVQIGIVSAEDIVFTLTEADVRFEAQGYVFLGSESFKENQSVAEYKQSALQAFGRLASALLGAIPVELTIKGYRAFAMGDVQIPPAGRAQVPPHLRSKSSTTSVHRKESIKRARNGSLSHSSSSTFSQKQVPWLDQAFQKVSIVTVVQKDLQPVLKDMQISRLFANFLRAGNLDADIDAVSFEIEVPLDVRFKVLSVEADVEVHYEGFGRVGTGRIDTDVLSCTPVDHSHGHDETDTAGKTTRLVRLAPGSLKLTTDASEGLAQLIAHIADCDETDRISIRGRARARVDVALGEICVDVDLGRQPHVLAMDGLRGLRSSPVQYTNLQVVEASREYLKIVFSLYLNNPSRTFQVALPDTDLTMAAFYRGAYVGRAHIAKGFRLGSGPVGVHDIHFRYCPPPEVEKAARDIPANFLSGRKTTLQIRGDDESSEIALLIPALKNIQLTFELKPMMDRTLIDSISIALGVTALTAASVDAQFVVNNPLGVPFDLCAMSFMATYRGEPFGSCTVTYEADHPLRVPAGSGKQPGQQQSSPVSVALAQPLENMVGAFLKSKGQLLLDIEVNASVEIQGFKIPNFNYRQPQLPLTIKGLEALSKWMKFLP